ncbi:MAG: hypothetical protein P9L92_19980 [Candidatus Electryonea clarkiae]|nr:hypothetical protein [Candidatus Electryonea clarkiae]MDP8288843.1 hypothetical protein [Candidatus Electryonea clarkiae]
MTKIYPSCKSIKLVDLLLEPVVPRNRESLNFILTFTDLDAWTRNPTWLLNKEFSFNPVLLSKSFPSTSIR